MKTCPGLDGPFYIQPLFIFSLVMPEKNGPPRPKPPLREQHSTMRVVMISFLLSPQDWLELKHSVIGDYALEAYSYVLLCCYDLFLVIFTGTSLTLKKTQTIKKKQTTDNPYSFLTFLKTFFLGSLCFSFAHKPPASHWGIVNISGIPLAGKGQLGLLDLFLWSCGFMILRDQLSPSCLAAEAIWHQSCCRVREAEPVDPTPRNTCGTPSQGAVLHKSILTKLLRPRSMLQPKSQDYVCICSGCL